MMRASVSGAVLGGLLMLAVPQAASSQELLLHFPLDGTPAVSGSAAGDSRLYLFDGGPAPKTVPGKMGGALYFNGTTVIAMPFSLDHVAYPEVTVTAWVKLDPDSGGERTVFSAGNGNVPRLMIYGDRAHFIAARGSRMYDKGMPRGEWTFVAGTVDVAGARLGTYQGEGHQTAEGIGVANLYGPSGYRNPEDASMPFGPYVFVGSHGFGQWRANGMAIDDVRVYASALTPEQIAAIREAGGATIAVADSAGAGTCSGGAACTTGTYCAVDGRCYPNSQLPVGYSPSADGSGQTGSPTFYQAPLTEESLAHVQEIRDENAAPVITYASEEEALAAQERREQEAAEQLTDDTETPMQAGPIDAVMDLQKIVIRQQNESRGDEYYLVVYKLRGRRGTGDRIYTFDYQRQVWPIAAGDNWAVRGSEFTIPQGAGRLSYPRVEPFEVYGFVAVLMEANNNTQAERQAAFGFGEFQNESGVTEVVGSAFDRAIPRDGQRPDYDDTTCSNVFRVADQNAHGLSIHFNFVGMREEGVAKAIRDAIRVPLQRSNPDRYDGAIWGFFMNSPGGSTCGDPFYRDREAYRVGIFPPPGAAPVGMSTESTTIYVKHSR